MVLWRLFPQIFTLQTQFKLQLLRTEEWGLRDHVTLLQAAWAWAHHKHSTEAKLTVTKQKTCLIGLTLQLLTSVSLHTQKQSRRTHQGNSVQGSWWRRTGRQIQLSGTSPTHEAGTAASTTKPKLIWLDISSQENKVLRFMTCWGIFLITKLKNSVYRDIKMQMWADISMLSFCFFFFLNIYISVFPHLYNIGGEPSIEPDPVARRDHTDASHTAEDRHPYPSPVVAEVMRVDLSTEDGQDERQDCQQVDLSPKLQDGRVTD